MAKVVREKTMAVSQGALFKAITDYNSYPKFLPEVVGVRIQAGGSVEKTIVQFDLEIVKRFQYTLQFETSGSERVAWKLIDSNFFKTNNGLWVLTPLSESSTQVRYELEVGFGFLVPSWVSKKLTEVNLPRMFESFESRANEISGKV